MAKAKAAHSANGVVASCQRQLPRPTRARYKNCILKVISSFAACHCELRTVDKRFARHFVLLLLLSSAILLSFLLLLLLLLLAWQMRHTRATARMLLNCCPLYYTLYAMIA